MEIIQISNDPDGNGLNRFELAALNDQKNWSEIGVGATYQLPNDTALGTWIKGYAEYVDGEGNVEGVYTDSVLVDRLNRGAAKGCYFQEKGHQ